MRETKSSFIFLIGLALNLIAGNHLKRIDAIILTGKINGAIENNFNINQFQKEKEKAVCLNQHPEDAETLFRLEDHPMLKGPIL